MAGIAGNVLVVDDSPLARKLLVRAVEMQGCRVTACGGGAEALALLQSAATAPFDVILLDILMPEMDGYQVLEQVKSDRNLRHIPVIVVSGVDDMDSIVRCIEMGAADYLPKPFNAALLRARLGASLAQKRLRDLEIEYLHEVARVVDAAESVERASFEPASLDPVAGRPDALGNLARVFQRMAREVQQREQRLRRQLEELRLDMQEVMTTLADPLSACLPMDRRHALASGQALPDRASGAVLFADVCGSTRLSNVLQHEMGGQRGAEEMTRAMNRALGEMIDVVHRFGGSVIGFSGDAITGWLDGDDGLRAIACALEMQQAMSCLVHSTAPGAVPEALAIKASVAAGPVRRFLVGDPDIQVIDVIAGRTLDALAAANRCAQQGEVVALAEIVDGASDALSVAAWRADDASGQRVAVISELNEPVGVSPWPALPPNALTLAQCRRWAPRDIYEQIRSGNQQFLSELRLASLLFLSFKGIDYDGDEDAGAKLDAFVRWVQTVVAGYEGALVNFNTGDKGSYLFAVFGAPMAHDDDAVRAVRAAQELRSCPAGLRFIGDVQIGLAQGFVRAGPFGSASRRSYDVIGDQVNLAARLMMAATGGLLCDESIYLAAREQVAFIPLPPIHVRGRDEPVAVYRPEDPDAESTKAIRRRRRTARTRLDRLSPAKQRALKEASVLCFPFSAAILRWVFGVEAERVGLDADLAALERQGWLVRTAGPDPNGCAHESLIGSQEPFYDFPEPAVREAVYSSMPFAQRRQMHRRVAEWFEQAAHDNLPPHYASLAHHWRAADEPARAIDCLEKAGQHARELGAYQEADRFFRESLELDGQSAVLSPSYYGNGGIHAGPDHEEAVRYALSRLEQELAPELVYHNLWHTRDEVLPAALRLADAMGVGEDDRRLLEVAAAYHDLGFVSQVDEHERVGAEIAAQVLPGFGFTLAQVATIQGLILATRIPQSPHTLLEEILCDADLENLGRDDACTRGRLLRAERATLGEWYTDVEWLRHQLQFMVKHRYFTAAACAQGNAGKLRNIAMLRRLIAESEPGPGPRRRSDEK